MSEVGLHGVSDVGEDVTGLLSAGFDNSEHRVHKATAPGALCAEGKLSPDDRVT